VAKFTELPILSVAASILFYYALEIWGGIVMHEELLLEPLQ
jgi:hypothetical protein